MIGAYLRVSTDGQNIDGQRCEIERWLENHNHSDVRWFIDKSSGKNLDRPAFSELQQAVFDGEIDTVVVWKIDRLSRTLRDGIAVLANWLEHDVRVIAVTQRFDFNGAVGRMVGALLLSVAEMEQEIRQERLAVGIAAAKGRGAYSGRKRGTYKAQPKRVLELRRQGLKDSEIANALKVSRSTVQRYLRIAETP
jgi:DNA invertase Pin-like site-specific DNA recombinase